MTYLLVPRDVTTTTATIWLGAIGDDPSGQSATVGTNGVETAVDGGWQRWVSRNGHCALTHRQVTLDGLEPRRSYSVDLRVGGQDVASGSVTTLPEHLPSADDKPFTLLLGSCFCASQDQAGSVGNAYFHLPGGARPDLKVLCGDQVYLDDPWIHYLWQTHSAAELEAELFENYRRTWTQAGMATGFQALLRDGANYFVPDDHDYWNNAPNRALQLRDTWHSARREDWRSAARTLYGLFQGTPSIARLAVPPLSFLFADQRSNREPGSGRFMADADLAALEAWVSGLSGPGVLVMGQSPFAAPTSPLWRILELGLADSTQYGDLARILSAAPHSIVLLSGDVHFGRVAVCETRPGVELVEVLSSPLALVNRESAGTWAAAPATFPAAEVPGLARFRVETAAYARADNHFVTVEFSTTGARVRMAVRSWTIGGVSQTPHGQVVFERMLQ